MGLNRKMRRAWFMHCLAWSTIGPFSYIFFVMKGELSSSILAGLLSGPPMAVGLYVFLFHLVPATKRLPFVLGILVQLGTIIAMLTVSFALGACGIDVIMRNSSPLDPQVWLRSAMFFQYDGARTAFKLTVASIFGLLMLWQLSKKLGPGVLISWISGYYHRPREEERIFMFLDIRNSTTLAEQLGNKKFSGLIQDFFIDIATPLLESRGVVSHYIGDEAVLTWKVKGGLRDANCLKFFFRMRQEIDARAGAYKEKYGAVPDFKAGAHFGQVIACEVGYHKSEVVYLGDVLNTAARIQGLCDKLGVEFLASADLVAALGEPTPGLNLRCLGPQELKGKAEPITVYAVAESA